MEFDEKLEFENAKINLYGKGNPIEVTVIDNEIITAGKSPNFIRHITFDVSGTLLENNILAGQSIGVLPPGVDDKGKPHQLRLYSVSSPSFGEDGEGKLYATTVKRLIDEHWSTQELYSGLCSNYLAPLKVGDRVKLTGPTGKRFLLPNNPTNFNYVFFSTGTGIAPFRGMVKELFASNMKNQVALIFGCAYQTDILYKKYFEEIAKKYSNFHYLVSVSREARRADGTSNYVQYQLLDNASLLSPILEKENTLVYICGLKGMEYDIYKLLALQKFENYFRFKKPLSDSPSEWNWNEIKGSIRPSEKLFVETY